MDSLLERLAQKHPSLLISRWSHSMGEANDLDGWAMGFRLQGLSCPIECRLYLGQIHGHARLYQGDAEWLRPDDYPVEIWMPEQPVESPLALDLADLRTALERAIVRGPIPGESVSVAMVHSYSTILSPRGQPEVRNFLTEAERDVYHSWFRHLSLQNVRPLHLSHSITLAHYHPHSASQIQQLASMLRLDWAPSGEALVGALFAPESLPPELQGPGLKVLARADDWSHSFPAWQKFYAENPRSHGIMSLSTIGFAGDQAAMLVYNQTGAFSEQNPAGERVEVLGNGYYLASFARKGRTWNFLELRRLSGAWLMRSVLEGELLLHFGERGRLTVADLPENRLRVRFEPWVGSVLEVLVMDRASLISETKEPLDCRGPSLLLPYLSSHLVIPQLEGLLAEL